MANSFKSQKDISFTDDAGKNVPGRLLTDFEGNAFKVFGQAAQSVELGTNYEFTVKSTDKNGVKLIDGRSMQKVGGASGTQASPSQSAPETDKRQASIEAQNARTNLSNLYDKLSPPEQFELVASLCNLAGITFDSAFHAAEKMPSMKAPGKQNG